MKSYITLICLVILSCGNTSTEKWKKFKFPSKTRARKNHSGLIWVPSANKTYPLIISLHGWNLSPKDQNKRMNFLYRNKDIIVLSASDDLCPDRLLEGSWSSCGVDELDELRQWAVQNYSIDEDRIFLGGYSAGGQAIYNYVRKKPHTVAGAIILSGNAWAERENHNTPAQWDVNIIHLHGTKDHLIYTCGKYPCYDHKPNGGKQHVIRYLDRPDFQCPDFSNPTDTSQPESGVDRHIWECGNSSISLYKYINKGHGIVVSKNIMLKVMDQLNL